jgi:uncharacterized protein (DUF2147 family)
MKSRSGRSRGVLLGLVALLISLGGPVTEAGSAADPLTGVWYFPYKKSYIEISRGTSAHYTGRIIAVTERNYIPYLDQVVIDGLRYQQGTWEGTFVHPTQKTRFGLSMNLVDPSQVRALIYKGYRVAGKSFDMKRADLPTNVYVSQR